MLYEEIRKLHTAYWILVRNLLLLNDHLAKVLKGLCHICSNIFKIYIF